MPKHYSRFFTTTTTATIISITTATAVRRRLVLQKHWKRSGINKQNLASDNSDGVAVLDVSDWTSVV